MVIIRFNFLLVHGLQVVTDVLAQTLGQVVESVNLGVVSGRPHCRVSSQAMVAPALDAPSQQVDSEIQLCTGKRGSFSTYL